MPELINLVTVVGEANPLFTVTSTDFQPIIDTLTGIVTAAVPAMLTIGALWVGIYFVQNLPKLFKKSK